MPTAVQQAVESLNADLHIDITADDIRISINSIIEFAWQRMVLAVIILFIIALTSALSGLRVMDTAPSISAYQELITLAGILITTPLSLRIISISAAEAETRS